MATLLRRHATSSVLRSGSSAALNLNNARGPTTLAAAAFRAAANASSQSGRRPASSLIGSRGLSLSSGSSTTTTATIRSAVSSSLFSRGTPLFATAAAASSSASPVRALHTAILPSSPLLLRQQQQQQHRHHQHHQLGATPFGALAGARRFLKLPGRRRLGGAKAQPIGQGLALRGGKWRRVKPKKLYKLKSHKGALKRFYQTADGTFWHKAAGKKHLMAGASRRRQTYRLLGHRAVTTPGVAKKLRRLLPYGTTLQKPKKYRQPTMWERPDGWTERVLASKKPGKDARAVAAAVAGKKKAAAQK